MNKSKVAILSSQIWQKIETILGWIISAFFLISFIGTITDSSDDPIVVVAMVLSLIFLALGVFMILNGKRRKKFISTFKEYVQILSGDPLNSLDTIAEKTCTSVDVVKTNVSEMIKRSFFVNAKIDKNTNSLVFIRKVNTHQVLCEKVSDLSAYATTNTSQKVHGSAVATQMFSVKCKGCGAVTVVPLGKIIECEYCGNMIKGE